jgi:hypothetical protein
VPGTQAVLLLPTVCVARPKLVQSREDHAVAVFHTTQLRLLQRDEIERRLGENNAAAHGQSGVRADCLVEISYEARCRRKVFGQHEILVLLGQLGDYMGDLLVREVLQNLTNEDHVPVGQFIRADIERAELNIEVVELGSVELNE